jgi:hypothetical protein
LLACSALGRQTWWLAWAELGLKNWANERKYLQNKHRVTRLLPSLLGDLGSFFQNFRSSRNILARYFFPWKFIDYGIIACPYKLVHVG